MTHKLPAVLNNFEKIPEGIPAESFSMLKNEMSAGKNLADLAYDWNRSNHALKNGLPGVIRALLVDRFKYQFLSFNLPDIVPNISSALQNLKQIDQFDVVLTILRSANDIELINPANPLHLEITESQHSRKLTVAYAKSKQKRNKDREVKFLQELKNALLVSPPIEKSGAATDADCRHGEAQTAQTQRVRVTPQYGIAVTNELFHYGNVEAWNNIIESYKSTFPGTEVLLFHRGQRIYRIYSLFGWGKIRFGDAIFFAVAGKVIKDVAKLKKYLSDAASPRFQPFIKRNPNMPLKLF